MKCDFCDEEMKKEKANCPFCENREDKYNCLFCHGEGKISVVKCENAECNPEIDEREE